MNFNILVLAGRIAAPPEVRVFDGGKRLIRYLVAVRTEEPRRRVDVVPVTMWDPSDDLLAEEPLPGQHVFVAGSVQRRFSEAVEGPRSRLEVIADQVCLRDEPEGELFAGPVTEPE